MLGGSFNPAHAGHRHIAELARKRLRLHQVWLMVSPGNPLKPAAGMGGFVQRLAAAAAIADGRRIVATGIEAALGTRYTCDTLPALRRRFPHVRFVWLMGADNLVDLPRWHAWRRIAGTMPFTVMPRPSYNHAALAGLAAQRLHAARRPVHEAGVLALQSPPAWMFLPTPQHAAARRRHSAAPCGPASSRTPRVRSRIIARKPPTDAGPPAKRPGSTAAGKPVRRRPPQPPAVLAQAAKAPGTPRKKAVAAGPRASTAEAAPKAAPRKKAEPATLDRVQAIIVSSLEDDKAEDVVALDLVGRASFADRMVIATGLADRQISAMAQHLEQKLQEVGIKRVQIEGAGGSDWVLIDAGDIVIHLFKAEARSLYGLERMWGVELDDPLP